MSMYIGSLIFMLTSLITRLGYSCANIPSSSSRSLVNTITSNKELILLRHGVTEMNEYLAKNPWGSPGFKDPSLWDTKLSLG